MNSLLSFSIKLTVFPHGFSLEDLTLKIKIRNSEELHLRRGSAEQRHRLRKKYQTLSKNTYSILHEQSRGTGSKDYY